MYIVIVGASGIGKRLTELALKDGNHNVIVIDKEQARCEEIARKYDAVAINAVKQWCFNSIVRTGNTIEQWGQVAFHFKL